MVAEDHVEAGAPGTNGSENGHRPIMATACAFVKSTSTQSGHNHLRNRRRKRRRHRRAIRSAGAARLASRRRNQSKRDPNLGQPTRALAQSFRGALPPERQPPPLARSLTGTFRLSAQVCWGVAVASANVGWPETRHRSRCPVSCSHLVSCTNIPRVTFTSASTDRAGSTASGCGVARERPALSDIPVTQTPVEQNRFAVDALASFK